VDDKIQGFILPIIMLRKDKEASTKTKWRTDITKKQTENRKNYYPVQINTPTA